MFDVGEFQAELAGDGARANLFNVALPLPVSGIANVGGSLDFNRKFTFMCRAASLPGDTITPVDVYYYSRQIKVAGNRQFSDWTVTVYNDEDFTIRNSMEKWMNALNSHKGNLRDPNAYSSTQYQVDATVTQLGKRGPEFGGVGVGGRPGGLKKYKFIGLWPVEVGPIDLAWDENDRIEEFSVTFAYNWWESVDDGVTT